MMGTLLNLQVSKHDFLCCLLACIGLFKGKVILGEVCVRARKDCVLLPSLIYFT